LLVNPDEEQGLADEEGGDEERGADLQPVELAAHGGGVVEDFKVEPGGAEFDFVAGLEPVLSDGGAVDTDAGGAFQVGEVVAVFAAFDGRMAVAHAGFREDKLAGGVATQPQPRLAHGERLLRGRSSLEKQAIHGQKPYTTIPAGTRTNFSYRLRSFC